LKLIYNQTSQHQGTVLIQYTYHIRVFTMVIIAFARQTKVLFFHDNTMYVC
jgi:hypothetical protein